MLKTEEIEMLFIKACVHRDTWEVSYKVPFALIEKYIPGYRFEEGMTIKANFYKCGDKMLLPHYGMWKEVKAEDQDFHRPEFFGEILFN